MKKRWKRLCLIDITPFRDVRVETRFKNLSLIINNYIINLIIEARARIKVLLLSVLSNFNNSFINIYKINILRIKDYKLIEILI